TCSNVQKSIKGYSKIWPLEKGMSQYAYYCFLIKKKKRGTSKLRVVGDMRSLNKFIIKNEYPLPIIRDILKKA
ncbi:16189_t:CDS:1, partial [Gigaspora margarita]